MRLSLNWLADFVELTVAPEVLADRLTMAGLEIDAIEPLSPEFSGVVVGHVTKVEPHPQADRLRLAEVTTGTETYRVVCGAPNLELGRLYPFAPIGAVVAGGQKIKAAKLRGIASEGMLCAEDELGLSLDHVGLMDIPQNLPVGADLTEALNLADVVLEVAVTANRSDCLSILGLAREVAALLDVPLRHPEVKAISGEESGELKAKVTILDPVHCPRYAARLLTGLTVKPSPFWMRRRLQASGIRAINNLVDVTNYVLLEFGQPLHAFDFTRLKNREIVVRLPAKLEQLEGFVTLDGQLRSLEQDTLLICDAERPVALAGVMGGLDSEVTRDTREVLIESAYFNPATIRRTSKRLGLSSEASYRFERGVDPDGVIHALERAAQLMCEVGGGLVVGPRLDEYPAPIQHPRLSLRVSRTNQVLGTNFSHQTIAGLLKRLHLPAVSLDRENLAVQVPSFRNDLTREVDLIEEVARLAGFETIPVTLPKGEVATRRPGPEARLRTEARQLLLGLGFNEVINYAFLSERLVELAAAPGAAPLALANPLSEEQAVMRTSLIPGLLDTLRRNILKQAQDLRLFETAKIFLPQPEADLPREETWLAGLMYGAREEVSWAAPREAVTFFDLKGVVEALLAGLQIPEVNFRREALPAYLCQGAKVYSGKRELGCVGELDPEAGDKLDVEGSIFVFNLALAALAESATLPLFTPLPRYPAVYRDIALVLPEEVPAAQVTEALYRFGAPWLEEAYLFDVYAGDQVPTGKRSLAFRLSYRDPERTLTEELINPHHQALVEAVGRELGGELR
ncbi:MAG: phenylalanine--tRNA ligase subunit beta [Deltaproteobacteria bacterium]|nr:phenylalanine--tRNA ligase subunit beta [Deltaproteobacteria bacterium]